VKYWSVTLKEEYRLMAYENRVLRKTSGSKMVELSGDNCVTDYRASYFTLFSEQS
jgi:hypothetical protein